MWMSIVSSFKLEEYNVTMWQNKFLLSTCQENQIPPPPNKHLFSSQMFIIHTFLSPKSYIIQPQFVILGTATSVSFGTVRSAGPRLWESARSAGLRRSLHLAPSGGRHGRRQIHPMVSGTLGPPEGERWGEGCLVFFPFFQMGLDETLKSINAKWCWTNDFLWRI